MVLRSVRGCSWTKPSVVHGIMPVLAFERVRSCERPALDPVPCWRVEVVHDLVPSSTPGQRESRKIYVREKLGALAHQSQPITADLPESVIIVGGGAAGNAAAETLRKEGYVGPITMLSADEAIPCDRPILSKGYLAGSTPEESNILRSPQFYRDQKIRPASRHAGDSARPGK
jgi:hypothetical protein